MEPTQSSSVKKHPHVRHLSSKHLTCQEVTALLWQTKTQKTFLCMLCVLPPQKA